jgi:TonB family protein
LFSGREKIILKFGVRTSPTLESVSRSNFMRSTYFFPKIGFSLLFAFGLGVRECAADVPSTPGEVFSDSGQTDSDAGLEVEYSGLDETPKVLTTVHPQYPAELQKIGKEGFVLLDFVIDVNGMARRIRPVVYNDRLFSIAAAEALNQWTFAPGRKHGGVINAAMEVPMMFSLRTPQSTVNSASDQLVWLYGRICHDWMGEIQKNSPKKPAADSGPERGNGFGAFDHVPLHSPLPKIFISGVRAARDGSQRPCAREAAVKNTQIL